MQKGVILVLIAIGKAYPICIRGGEEFVIGTKEGKEIPVFVNGKFAF